MKSDDLKLDELIDFSEGWLSLKGRRLIIMDMRALLQLRKDLTDFLGTEQTRRILSRLGYFWGQADAAAMKRIFSWDNTTEWLRAGPKLLTIQGLTKAMIKSMSLDEKSKKITMEMIWNNSYEADHYDIESGASNICVCWMLAAYSSGYASFCLGTEVYFIEEKCRGKGDRICKASGKDRKSWGDAINPFLPYFQSDDIHGKIISLTKKLKRKQSQLERQRKKIASVYPKINKDFANVRSRSFHQVLDLSTKVAHFDSTVLITGESGVGKEVLARYIHTHSHRSKGPFIAINCGALPDTLLESELFGHTKGAFTGANKDRIGLFEEARKGTIFLDEIGDISPAMQIKILRVLQEREILRLGENKPRKIDVRIIAATNKDLAKEIEQETFREDLYYRLAVVEIHIPPLRERREDILPLARYFVKQFSRKLRIPRLKLDPATLDVLQEYTWPGNIRQLENAIERASVVSRDGILLPENLPASIHRSLSIASQLFPVNLSLEKAMEQHIANVLHHTEGNRTKAARILGISSATLWRKTKQMESKKGDRL